MNFIDIYNMWGEKQNIQFLSLLDCNPDAIAVDLGCGDGEFSIRVIKQIWCKEMYGTEVWDEAIKQSSKKRLKLIMNRLVHRYSMKNFVFSYEVIKCDLNEKLPFADEFFDIVVSNQVVEHLLYLIQFIMGIKRILKSGGTAIISTENLSSWDNIAALVFGWTPFSVQFDIFMKIGNPLSPHNNEKFDHYPPHLRIFTYKGLISAFEQIGFNILDIKGTGYIPFNFLSSVDKRHCRFLTIKVRK